MMLAKPQARVALGLFYSQNRQWLLDWLRKQLI